MLDWLFNNSKKNSYLVHGPNDDISAIKMMFLYNHVTFDTREIEQDGTILFQWDDSDKEWFEIHGTHPILRYLGRVWHMYPNRDAFNAALVDMSMDELVNFMLIGDLEILESLNTLLEDGFQYMKDMNMLSLADVCWATYLQTHQNEFNLEKVYPNLFEYVNVIIHELTNEHKTLGEAITLSESIEKNDKTE
jgi:hypothetical protein